MIISRITQEFWGFIKKPSMLILNPKSELLPPLALRVVLWVLVLDVIAVFVFIGVALLAKFVGECSGVSLLVESAKNDVRPLLDITLSAILFAPVLEELGFRFGLGFKQGQVATSLALILSLAIGVIGSAVAVSSFFENLLNPYVWFLSVFVFLFLVKQPLIDRVKQYYSGTVVYILSVLFALLHVFNYEVTSLTQLPYLLFLMVFFTFAGLLLSYVRIRIGFVYGVALHILHNGLILLLYILFPSLR